ncbi:RNA polymerase sigma factor [Chryseobacterium gregarium]|uniref:RNA polymerase sigma factor n=1 Tax=Chryseobacterium gregarium TaxID=456299 RepID=UPI000400180F|nr:sigma factor [Chryseobacterium gregarium]
MQTTIVKDKSKAGSDKALLSLIKKDPEAGFDELYGQYSCTLYGLAIHAVRSQEYAEEIVQLTFVRILDRINLFKDQAASMCTWVIQNLVMTIQEFLTSKNIRYQLKTDRFPVFTFEWEKEADGHYQIADPDALGLQII